ncbi:MAG TPA: hypothetical protein VF211_06665 [Burkholderiales bacterium]
MPRKSTKTRSKKRRAEPRRRPEEIGGRVIERPDGFYIEKPNGETLGPYATLAEAEADLLADGAIDDLETGDSLQQAESELGISEWIDPDTGGPAEDNIPRLEDH